MSLLVSPAMKQLIDDAKASFDWVIADTPPFCGRQRFPALLREKQRQRHDENPCE